MKKIFLSLVSLTIACGVGCGGKEEDAPSVQAGVGNAADPRFSQLISFVSGEMEAHHVPGASVAVVENGQLAFSAGLGVREDGRPEPVVPTTLFRVASLSKMVLAATALSLQEQGKLDVTRPVTAYAPLPLQAPFDPSTVTVSELLSHTAGVPDVEVTTLSCPVGAGQIAAWFEAQGPQPLWTPPGEVWNYSNRGYAAAGWALENAAGQTYESAATARVLGPAGMTTATFDVTAARAQNHAIGHVHSNGAYQKSDVDAFDCAAMRAPAGVIASAVDYAHLAETLLAGGGTMLTPASVAMMETGHADTDQRPDGARKYGFGIEAEDNYKGLHVLHHNGDLNTGFRTSMWIVPDSKLAVIVFYNALGANPDDAGRSGLDAFLGIGGVPAPVETTPPSTWETYAGTYFDPFNLGTVDVSLANNALTLDAPQAASQSVALTQSAGDSFNATLAGKSGRVVFYPGDSGPATWLVTRQGVAKRQ